MAHLIQRSTGPGWPTAPWSSTTSASPWPAPTADPRWRRSSFIDLDDFKPINDTLGHRTGGELLVRIAERLRSAVRPSDTLGRWGGDEFVIVCEDLVRASDAPTIVARLAAAFDRPFAVVATKLSITASIGVAVSGGGEDHPTALIHAADIDMYRVKRDLQDGDGDGLPTPVFPAALCRPKLERLIRFLLDLLAASVARNEDPAEEAVAPGLAALWAPAAEG